MFVMRGAGVSMYGRRDLARESRAKERTLLQGASKSDIPIR